MGRNKWIHGKIPLTQGNNYGRRGRTKEGSMGKKKGDTIDSLS